MTLTLADCRAILRPTQERNSLGNWTIWRNAEGRQVHAALDPDNITVDVLREAVRQSGLCLGCDADGCSGPESDAPWCLAT